MENLKKKIMWGEDVYMYFGKIVNDIKRKICWWGESKEVSDELRKWYMKKCQFYSQYLFSLPLFTFSSSFLSLPSFLLFLFFSHLLTYFLIFSHTTQCVMGSIYRGSVFAATALLKLIDKNRDAIDWVWKVMLFFGKLNGMWMNQLFDLLCQMVVIFVGFVVGIVVGIIISGGGLFVCFLNFLSTKMFKSHVLLSSISSHTGGRLCRTCSSQSAQSVRSSTLCEVVRVASHKHRLQRGLGNVVWRRLFLSFFLFVVIIKLSVISFFLSLFGL